MGFEPTLLRSLAACLLPLGYPGVPDVRFELTHNCILGAAPLPFGVIGLTHHS